MAPAQGSKWLIECPVLHLPHKYNILYKYQIFIDLGLEHVAASHFPWQREETACGRMGRGKRHLEEQFVPHHVVLLLQSGHQVVRLLRPQQHRSQPLVQLLLLPAALLLQQLLQAAAVLRPTHKESVNNTRHNGQGHITGKGWRKVVTQRTLRVKVKDRSIIFY